MSKPKRQRLTTPKGIAKFPRLNTPDTKFNANGEYKVSLILDPAEHQDFLDMLDQLADEAYEAAKEDILENGKGSQKARENQAKQVVRNEPYIAELDQDGEETGMAEVRFKMKALIKTKDGRELSFSPKLFDAQGQPIDPAKVEIWGGSVIRVNFTPSPYYVAATKSAGVSLQLNAVQVLELVTGGGGNAESFGFEVEEGGYSAPAVDDDEDSNSDDEGEFDDDGSDF